MKYGIILGVLLVIYGLIYRYANLEAVPGAGWVFYLAGPILIVFALLAARRSGALSLAGGLGAVFLVSLVGASIYAAYVYGFNAFIDDSLLQTVRADGIAKIESSISDPEKQASRKELIDVFTSPPLFAATIWMQLLIAYSLIGVILAAILRRRVT